MALSSPASQPLNSPTGGSSAGTTATTSTSPATSKQTQLSSNSSSGPTSHPRSTVSGLGTPASGAAGSSGRLYSVGGCSHSGGEGLVGVGLGSSSRATTPPPARPTTAGTAASLSPARSSTPSSRDSFHSSISSLSGSGLGGALLTSVSGGPNWTARRRSSRNKSGSVSIHGSLSSNSSQSSSSNSSVSMSASASASSSTDSLVSLKLRRTSPFKHRQAMPSLTSSTNSSRSSISTNSSTWPKTSRTGIFSLAALARDKHRANCSASTQIVPSAQTAQTQTAHHPNSIPTTAHATATANSISTTSSNLNHNQALSNSSSSSLYSASSSTSTITSQASPPPPPPSSSSPYSVAGVVDQQQQPPMPSTTTSSTSSTLNNSPNHSKNLNNSTASTTANKNSPSPPSSSSSTTSTNATTTAPAIPVSASLSQSSQSRVNLAPDPSLLRQKPSTSSLNPPPSDSLSSSSLLVASDDEDSHLLAAAAAVAQAAVNQPHQHSHNNHHHHHHHNSSQHHHRPHESHASELASTRPLNTTASHLRSRSSDPAAAGSLSRTNPPSQPYTSTDSNTPPPVRLPPQRGTSKMHQTSSRLLRVTEDDRPFTRDFKDLFSTLMVSLPLTPHRVRLTRVDFSFLSEEAIQNLGSLKFSQSNRMPDPKDPSRIVTTTTTTTFSMAREMARSVCQRFLEARFIEAGDGKVAKEFVMKGGVWQLTPKGIHVLQRFCARNGINQKHIADLLASPRNTMHLVILERDSASDKISVDRSSIEVIFRRLIGTNGPNVKSSTTSADSDSLSDYKDGLAGVKMASERKVGTPPRTVYQTFTGKATVDWLMDCCTTIDRRETLEMATLFVDFDLMWCVQPDKSHAAANPQDSKFQPTKNAIYQMTQRGKDVVNLTYREKSTDGEASVPPRPGVSRDSNTQKLDKILNDPALRLLFRENLRDTHCEENLAFYLEVEEFLTACRSAIKNASAGRSASRTSNQNLDAIRETMASAYGIYNAFLAPGSPCELNIDHMLRNQLAMRMTKAVGQDSSLVDSLREVNKLFEEAQLSVFKLMASDSVPKFMKSPKYEQQLRNYDFDSLQPGPTRYNSSNSVSSASNGNNAMVERTRSKSAR